MLCYLVDDAGGGTEKAGDHAAEAAHGVLTRGGEGVPGADFPLTGSECEIDLRRGVYLRVEC